MDWIVVEGELSKLRTSLTWKKNQPDWFLVETDLNIYMLRASFVFSHFRLKHYFYFLSLLTVLVNISFT